jgi:CheY-like chemotaxis protein
MKKLMIVDDEYHIRHTSSLLLEKAGYEIVEVESGVACLERLRASFEGIILLDVSMPGLDGWGTMRDENLLAGNLVCMVTGTIPGEDSSGLEDCVFDYLLKPFSRHDLLNMVATAQACLHV